MVRFNKILMKDALKIHHYKLSSLMKQTVPTAK